MSRNNQDENFDRARSGVGTALKGGVGAKAAGKGYEMRLDTSDTCKVNVLKKGAGKAEPVFRLDAPHRGAQYPHMNINPKVSTGFARDPHLPIGSAGLKTGRTAARVAKGANKVLVPVAVVVDTVNVGVSMKNDAQRGTTRNTVETTAEVAGGWGGAFGGAEVGAAIGTAICPGVGTIAGGIIGGVAGGIGGSIGAGKLAEKIGDANEYDIGDGAGPCKQCGRKYKYRKYLRRDNGYCDECQEYA